MGGTRWSLSVCTEGRDWFGTDYPNWLKEAPKKFEYDDRSSEHGSYIIDGA